MFVDIPLHARREIRRNVLDGFGRLVVVIVLSEFLVAADPHDVVLFDPLLAPAVDFREAAQPSSQCDINVFEPILRLGVTKTVGTLRRSFGIDMRHAPSVAVNCHRPFHGRSLTERRRGSDTCQNNETAGNSK